jgi:hypothetical protein
MASAILKELDRGPGPRANLLTRAADFSEEVVITQYESLLLQMAKQRDLDVTEAGPEDS